MYYVRANWIWYSGRGKKVASAQEIICRHKEVTSQIKKKKIAESTTLSLSPLGAPDLHLVVHSEVKRKFSRGCWGQKHHQPSSQAVPSHSNLDWLIKFLLWSLKLSLWRVHPYYNELPWSVTIGLKSLDINHKHIQSNLDKIHMANISNLTT